MFIVINLKKIIALALCVIGTGLLTYGSFCNDNEKVIFTSSEIFEPNYTIVIDAGHGEPDGGAVSVSGVREADLNLQISKMLEEELIALGYDVIMTRTSEKNIANSELQNSTIRKIKVSDINNRIEIANSSNADMLISIHMNKFSQEKYYGWQTFYKKKSELSKVLAKNVQEGISNNIFRENNRTELPIDNIKLIDKCEIPAIIVECGFLSNHEDIRLLQTQEYKQQIVNGIIDGIEEFYNINK